MGKNPKTENKQTKIDKKKLALLKKKKLLKKLKKKTVTEKVKASKKEKARKESQESVSEEAPATINQEMESESLQTKDIAKIDYSEMSYDSSFFSKRKFSELDLCPQTQKALDEVMKFDRMTHIQDKTIPHLLKGRDVLGAAKTGSGKRIL